jgi:hypothetical protein
LSWDLKQVHRTEETIPDRIRKAGDFDKVVPENGESDLFLLTVNFDREHVTCDGLFVPLDFDHCAFPVPIQILQKIFGEMGTFSCYVRDENKKPLLESLQDLQTTITGERPKQKGGMFRKFYPEKQHHSNDMPFIILGQVS